MQSIYEKNLNALQNKNNSLAQKINNINNKDDNINAFKTKKGTYTFEIKNKNNNYILLHSKYDPVKQAQKTISKLDFDMLGLYLILGIGGGYYIREMLKKIHYRSTLFVIENRLDILKKVMETNDLTDIFKNKNVVIMDGSDDNIQESLKTISLAIPVLSKMTADIQVFTTPVLKDIEADEYKRIISLAFDTFKFTSRTIGNDPGDTLQGLNQIFTNTQHLLNSPDFNDLKDSYAGKPAICVAAGPSLSKNIDELKRLQDKAIIISVDTMLERLLAEGVKPDIVGVLERGEIVYDSFFKDKDIDDDITLIGQSVVYPKIFNDFPGERVVCLKEGINIEEWIADLLPGVLTIPSGNSVANMNFSIARYLGCNPIIFVGQDLAYGEDGTTHVGGTIYDGDTVDEDKKTKNGELDYIEGINGEELLTRKWWKVFHYWFEMEIKKTDAKVIDATEGGALIKGTDILTLKKVGEKYCNDNIEQKFNNMLTDLTEQQLQERIDNMEVAIKDRLENLKEVEKTVQDAIDILKELKDYFEEANKLDKKIAEYVTKINKKYTAIMHIDKIFMFIVQSLLVTEGRNDSKLGVINSIEKYNTWFKNKSVFFLELKGICEMTEKIFEYGLEEIESVELGVDL